uniref:Uncharacterized protein n=1 Tax=Rhizophora mucronata TaxID=61149 RepID=A0A2P2IWT5_RHIMU
MRRSPSTALHTTVM